ncbi:MAG: glycoside hydrolase [Spongiibacteraceae bacterium]
MGSNYVFSNGLLAAKKNKQLVAIRIDRQQRFQTMEGFGGYGAKDVWWHTPPHFDRAFIDMLINDLGITMLRDSVPFGLFATAPDNFSSRNLDLFSVDLSARIAGDEAPPIEHFHYLKAMHDAGLQKLIVSIWSPPPWMKHNRQLNNGSERTNSAPAYSRQPNAFTNQLQRDRYAEFAEYCVAYIKLLKLKTGIDLYAISLQNEPRFSQFYASAVYDPQSLADLIQTVGDRFREEDIATKIFAPEDVNIPAYVTPFLNEIIQNSGANQYVTAFAVHDYKADGIRPQADNIKSWEALAKIASAADKAVWMTETSGYEDHSIESAIALARSIHDAITFGNASVWLYWQMSVNKGDGLIVDGRPTYLYYVSKQFYRFVQPGFVRVSAMSTDPDLLVLAFSSPAENAITTILINTSNVARTVQFAAGISQCERAITTNATESYQVLSGASVAPQFVVSALSVTSLSGCR